MRLSPAGHQPSISWSRGIIIIIIITIIIIIVYVHVSSTCTDLVQKRVRFPQGLSIVL